MNELTAWVLWPEGLEAIKVLPFGELEFVGLEGLSGQAQGAMHSGVESLVKELRGVLEKHQYEKRIEELEAALAAKEGGA